MVPKDLIDYFWASSAVAGTLVGLLFVSITLRYDAIFASSPRKRAIASAAFTALANSLSLSLWALVPQSNLGYPAAIIASFSLFNTFRTHLEKGVRRDTSTPLFVFSLLVYLFEIVSGIILMVRPHDTGLVFGLAYTVFGSFATGLSRSWQLLQPDESPVVTPTD